MQGFIHPEAVRIYHLIYCFSYPSAHMGIGGGALHSYYARVEQNYTPPLPI